ncbi:family 10 glycosylhydrolase [Streptomyces bambusae]|uniref:glycoside hydrolase family 10 protein n=1 Tax=Streptomyces bambusae TaxID=1550616 RepID=UPI001CFFB5E7|nr:family 10 glycosylhydrolase [Streptomyces bambusae]MCB5170278.1 family 10 glycosylhydrolase [Streptomyces bambusae]
MGRRGLLAGAAGAVAGAVAGTGAGPGAGAAAAAGPPGGTGTGRRGGGEPAADGAAEAVTGRRGRGPEFRGMWIASVLNVDWPSRTGLSAARQRAELTALLDTAVKRRLNAVVLQVRPTADALWPSEFEPWSQWLTGVQGRDPGWDPLGTAVAEAHARGLELHAWFNPYRVANHTDPSRLVSWHPARRRPDWTVAYGGKLCYNPGLPEVRAFVQDAMLDAVERYPVDAVHWDDYFYPYPVAGQTFDDEDAYREYGGAFESRAAWRRHNTDALVEEMSWRIAQVRPGTRFGISPFGIWRNKGDDPEGSDTTGLSAYDELHADTRRWVREGWLDYVTPQVYWHIGNRAADYAVLVPWWARTVRGTGVDLYVGEALYRSDPDSPTAAWRDPAELSRHLTLAARHAEVRGHVFFSAKHVAADPGGAMARVVADHYATAVPPRR